MKQRNSIKKQVPRKDQRVFDLTEMGYNLRILFMKSLYLDGSFADALVDNAINRIGDMVIDSDSRPNHIQLEISDIVEYSDIISKIEEAYIDTLYDFESDVEDILDEYEVDISIDSIPIMTNITRCDNIVNIRL